MRRTPPTGQRAVIVANGPSVDAIPPAFWRGCEEDDSLLLIGTNRSLCLCALQGVRLDAAVIRDVYRNLWYKQEWGCRYHDELWKPYPCYKVGPAHSRYTHCDEFVRFLPGWQGERVYDHNHEAATMKQSSVALMAANWAWFQGCTKIAFVGVDYCSSEGHAHAEMIPPWCGQSPGWEGQYDKPVPASIERDFRVAREAVEAHDGSMVNLSPGTRLEAVPLAGAMDWLR